MNWNCANRQKDTEKELNFEKDGIMKEKIER